MKSKYRVEKATSTTLSRDRLRNCSNMNHLDETIHKHKNTIILVFVIGKPKTNSIETDCQHSAGIGRGCKGARDEGLGFSR